ncbi:hypothetical protein GCM10027073_68490 [Streptomyces chlorus]|uniref:Secreted protein n=1 Tax=Streptomyces chlorus TaxID=887452 RepID=A0ABW1E433_9ACTN
MSHPVLALGAAAVTAAGSVWYLPALADLRAGADRPASRRTGAVACLSGWTTAAAVAVLLLLTDSWWPPCAAALAGATATTGLWTRAAIHRRRGAREAARLWAQLGWFGPPDRSRTAFVAVVLTGGLVAATTTTAVLWAHGQDTVPLWLTTAPPLTLVALSLALALTATRRTRHREHGAPVRPARQGSERHDVPG